MHEDFDRCHRAVQSRDPRFDGWFVTAVLSTGIYCRPSCPARTPKAANLRFFATAAAAQHAGFRACKRCRPDASPGSPEWSTRADTAARAMRLVADGVVDREGVAGLAHRLGYSSRHVERLLLAEVGAGPLALARAQRAQTARILIETTELAMADIAFAAGFASIRQFNDTVRSVFDRTPTALRAARSAVDARPGPIGPTTTGDPMGPMGSAGPAVGATTLVLRLAVRTPFTPGSALAHLAATAVPGVEVVDATGYRRALAPVHGPALVALTPGPDHVVARLSLHDLRDLPSAIARSRRLLDLDADPTAVADALATDRRLRAAVRAEPGLRLPRTMDEAELALRVVLGQQVSTAAARTHAARLVRTLGSAVADGSGDGGAGIDSGASLGPTHRFPAPDVIAAADPSTLGLPAGRGRVLVALATALADGRVDLSPGADWLRARAELAAIPGIGPWSIEMIALRGLGDPDAFPATDLGVRRGAAALGLPGSGPGEQGLATEAHRWRPWRSYAAAHLWAADPDGPGRAPSARPSHRRTSTNGRRPSNGAPR